MSLVPSSGQVKSWIMIHVVSTYHQVKCKAEWEYPPWWCLTALDASCVVFQARRMTTWWTLAQAMRMMMEYSRDKPVWWRERNATWLNKVQGHWIQSGRKGTDSTCVRNTLMVMTKSEEQCEHTTNQQKLCLLCQIRVLTRRECSVLSS